ncbi:MAG: sugar transferase [Bacteroidales bacterium]|nr:sugar transferase [Bacteroidales bacterium]
MANHRNIILRKLVYLFIDLLIVAGSFLFFAWLKPATKAYYLPTYFNPILFFTGVWLFTSLLIGKFDVHTARKTKDVIIPILIANITVLAVVITLIYSFNAFIYSRLIVFGTIVMASGIEVILSYLYFSYKMPVNVPEFEPSPSKLETLLREQAELPSEHLREEVFSKRRDEIRKAILEEYGNEVYEFIDNYTDVGNPETLVVSTTTQFNIDKLQPDFYKQIINLYRINDIRRLNKFFEAVNSKLPYQGLFIGNAETYSLRKERILRKYPPFINRIVYFFDYIFTRVFPKMPVLKKIYFFITLGKGRVLSRAETLGRLYSCGFEVVREEFIRGLLYFTVRKIKEPAFDYNPTYGPFVRLRRLGKNGRIIGVYKLRTMHAYSEYLQEYVYLKNSLQEGGKFRDDFRVTAAGRILRKFWLDELPMLINLIKGDMKLVGVRPLSRHYLNLYPEEARKKRMRYKPGLIPPFYADMPKTLDDITASEMKYLEAYDKNPFLTDLSYFFRAVYNIIFRKARSQ